VRPTASTSATVASHSLLPSPTSQGLASRGVEWWGWGSRSDCSVGWVSEVAEQWVGMAGVGAGNEGCPIRRFRGPDLKCLFNREREGGRPHRLGLSDSLPGGPHMSDSHQNQGRNQREEVCTGLVSLRRKDVWFISEGGKVDFCDRWWR
jgi:hypothetical protein